jgi:hypothetical protein
VQKRLEPGYDRIVPRDYRWAFAMKSLAPAGVPYRLSDPGGMELPGVMEFDVG